MRRTGVRWCCIRPLYDITVLSSLPCFFPIIFHWVPQNTFIRNVQDHHGCLETLSFIEGLDVSSVLYNLVLYSSLSHRTFAHEALSSSGRHFGK